MTDHSPISACPDCGTPLPPDSPQALCPACLMRQALASRTIVEGDPNASTTPPFSPEEIAGKFPGFEILECLGRGGMGVVYKARQKSLNRIVAIKILAPERGGETRFAERFAREAEFLAKLNHPHIVTIHDFGETAGLFYLVMEFVDGVNLRDLLRDGKLEPQQALAIVPPICDALQYAHDKGIVHRDIKPENLLLDRDGRIKIADFGISALMGTDGDPSGTPPYMAPEQCGASPEVDNRADIYALGVVLYEMLTGERPKKELIAPSKKVHIDVRLDEIVLRALEKTPELRYQTAGIFKTQVETIVSEMASAAVAVAKSETHALTESRFSRTAIVGACLGLIHIILLPLVHYTWQGNDFSGNPHPDRPPYAFLVYTEWAFFVGSLIAMTILGWKAVGQIRRSGGRLHGMWLALFDGLLLPLFVAAMAGGLGIHFLLEALNKLLWSITGRDPEFGLSHWIGMILCALILTPLVIWFVRRKVSKPLAGVQNPEQPKLAPSQPPAAETKPTRLGKWALGLFIGAVVGAPVLWGFMGAQEVIVLCGLALLLSFVLGLMSWRFQSGKFAALASGLGLLLLSGFTFNYLTPRYPARDGSGNYQQESQDKLPNRVLFTFSHDGNRKPMLGQRIALAIEPEGDTGWQPANGQAMRLADGRTVLFKVRIAQSEAEGLIGSVASRMDNAQDWQENHWPLGSNAPPTFTFANGLRVSMNAEHSDERADPNKISIVPIPNQSQARKSPFPSGILNPAIGIGALLMVSLALGVVGWRTRSGKVVTLASGLGLLLLVAFTSHYLTPRPPRGPYEGGGVTSAYTPVKDNLLAAMSARYGAEESRFELGKPIDLDLLFLNHSPIDMVINPQELPPAAWLTVTTSAGERVELKGTNQAASVLKEPRVVKSRDGTGGYAMTLLLLPKDDTTTAKNAKADAMAWVEPGTYTLQFHLRLPPTSYQPDGSSKDEYRTVPITIELAGSPTKAKAITPSAAFGEVVERDLILGEKEKLRGLYLESGNLTTLSEDEYGRGLVDIGNGRKSGPRPVDWFDSKQLDIAIFDRGHDFRIAGRDGKFVLNALPTEKWETASYKDVRDAVAYDTVTKLKSKRQSALTLVSSDGHWAYLKIPPDAELPLTYAMKSGDKLGLLQITAHLRNPDGIQLRYKLLEEDFIDQVVPNVYGRGLEGVKCFDFESNRLHTPPEALADELLSAVNRAQTKPPVEWHYVSPALIGWLDQTGVDVVAASIDSGAVLLSLGPGSARVVVMPLKPFYEEIDPSQAAFGPENLRFPENALTLERIAYLGWPRKPGIEFYGFTTREGNRGDLQITGITDDGFRDVKIRYKLVQSAPPVKSAPKKQYEVSIQFGQNPNDPVVKTDVELGTQFGNFKKAGDRLFSINGQIDEPKNGKFPGSITLGDYNVSEAYKGTGHQGTIPVELELGKPFNHTVVVGIGFIRIITLNEKPASSEPSAGEPATSKTDAGDGAWTEHEGKAGEGAPVNLNQKMEQSAAPEREKNVSLPPSFGPVIERMLPTLGAGKACLLDLDTGEFHTPPDDLAESLEPNSVEKAELTRASLRWLRESRVEITASPVVSDMIQVLGAIMIVPAGEGNSPPGFDDMTPAIVLQTLSGSWLEREINPMVFRSFLSAGLGTHVFITPEGAMGVMEIPAGNGDPAGVKIRYKLLRGAKPGAEAMAAAKATWDLPPVEPVKELKIPMLDLPDGTGREGYRLTVEPGDGDYVLATLKEYEGHETAGEDTPVKHATNRLLRVPGNSHSEDIFLDSHWIHRPSRENPSEISAITDRCTVSGFGQQIVVADLDFSGAPGSSAKIGDGNRSVAAWKRFKFDDYGGDKSRTRLIEFQLRVIRKEDAVALAERHGISLPDENVANWAITLADPRADPAAPHTSAADGSWGDHFERGEIRRAQQGLEDALVSYRHSLEAAQSEMKQRPQDTAWQAYGQRRIKKSHTRIGDVLCAQGDLAGALENYRAGRASIEPLVRQEPADEEQRNELTALYVKIGDVLQAQGDKAGALAAFRKAQEVDFPDFETWEKQFDESIGGSYNASIPFKPEELRQLAAKPLSEDRNRDLERLILRAGAEKDASFRYLLDQPELRKDEEVNLALIAYDYSVNGNTKALDDLLARLAKEKVGSDSSVVAALAFVDEWDRVPKAVAAHFVHADGSGGELKSFSKAWKAYLFPRNSLKHEGKAGEGAPVKIR